MLKQIALIGLLAYAVHFCYKGALIFGFHKIVHKHHPGPCHAVPNIDHGAEDVTLLPGDKILITSGLRLLERHNPLYDGVKTGVLFFDFNQPEKGVQKVTISGIQELSECDFHGISSWIDPKTGEVRIFIVNHFATESVIEIFIYDDAKKTLFHQETIGRGDPNFRLLNDVAAVGPRQFYVSNYLYMRTKFETFLQLKWGFVTYFDGLKSHVASDERFLQANGISASNDGRYIYMVHISEREIITFKRNGDNTLTIKERVPLYTLPDNIVVDPDNGDLWLGCHFVGHLTIKYLEAPTELSPSQVLRLKVKDGSVTEVTQVMMDDGKLISGSSVAVYRKNQMFVGTVASNAVLCEVKYI